jgi:hypothetical protein
VQPEFLGAQRSETLLYKPRGKHQKPKEITEEGDLKRVQMLFYGQITYTRVHGRKCHSGGNHNKDAN